MKLYRPPLLRIPILELKHQIHKWVDGARREQSLISDTTFKFLNQKGDLSQLGWNGELPSKLWRYNQHYFDDLNAFNSSSRRHWHYSLIERWISENRLLDGVGWEPYPTSLRIVNWLKYYLAGSSPNNRQLESLSAQTEWLSKRLEYHLLGNHLFANAKALYFAGCFFDGKNAKRWLKRSRKIINHELTIQILDDGGHFELSPMYHAIFLEDLLDLINIAHVFGHIDDVVSWSDLIPKMIHWLQAMSHPDKGISFFNDAAFNVAPSNDEIFSYARRLGFDIKKDKTSTRYLKSSGYVRMETQKAIVLCDIGKVGPEFLPGHGHADTLSFELSLYGQRVFVNSGTSEYGISPERLRQRGTEAHNTVMINGQNSSEVWSGFRVARRAYTFDCNVKLNENSKEIIASHNGYHRLAGKPTHSRSWKLTDHYLEVIDIVSGFFKTCTIFYHLHPEVDANFIGKNTQLLSLFWNKSFHTRVFIEGADAELLNSSWHPEFGISIPTKLIKLQMNSNKCIMRIEF